MFRAARRWPLASLVLITIAQPSLSEARHDLWITQVPVHFQDLNLRNNADAETLLTRIEPPR